MSKLRRGKHGTCLERETSAQVDPIVTHHGLHHAFARTLRKRGYSMQQIGKLFRHQAGSSVTVMYADMADDEVVELGREVDLGSIQDLAKT